MLQTAPEPLACSLDYMRNGDRRSCVPLSLCGLCPILGVSKLKCGNATPWAARGEADIYTTRAVQLGLAPEQQLIDVILCRIDELPQLKAEEKKSRLSFNGKMAWPLGKTQPHTRARITLRELGLLRSELVRREVTALSSCWPDSCSSQRPLPDLRRIYRG